MTYDPTAPVRCLVLRTASTGGAVEEIVANDGDVLRGLVGGWLEPLALPDGSTMWMDEEGKMHQRPTNVLAMRLLAGLGVTMMFGDKVCGDVVVTGTVAHPDPEHGAVCGDVPEEIVEACREAGVQVAAGA